MTAERARYIVTHRIVHDDGITPEEDREITVLWDTMPGNTSYYSAVCRIANEENVSGT